MNMVIIRSITIELRCDWFRPLSFCKLTIACTSRRAPARKAVVVKETGRWRDEDRQRERERKRKRRLRFAFKLRLVQTKFSMASRCRTPLVRPAALLYFVFNRTSTPVPLVEVKPAPPRAFKFSVSFRFSLPHPRTDGGMCYRAREK